MGRTRQIRTVQAHVPLVALRCYSYQFAVPVLSIAGRPHPLHRVKSQSHRNDHTDHAPQSAHVHVLICFASARMLYGALPERMFWWIIVERWYPDLKEKHRDEIRSAAFSTKKAATTFAAALDPLHDGGLLRVVAVSELEPERRQRRS
jgi:hypothetical protein